MTSRERKKGGPRLNFEQEGKVRWIGTSNFALAELRSVQAIAPITSIQPSYSLIRREIEPEILPWCRQNNVWVIVYSPMASGLLTGAMTRERVLTLPAKDWRSRSPEFKDPKLAQNLALAERLTAIGKRHGRSAGEVAIAWTLRLPSVTGAIVGARSPEQVDGIVGGATFELSDQELAEIEGPG